jgi:hypothetical protein
MIREACMAPASSSIGIPSASPRPIADEIGPKNMRQNRPRQGCHATHAGAGSTHALLGGLTGSQWLRKLIPVEIGYMRSLDSALGLGSAPADHTR